MRRVLILGCPCAGKSTLARELAALTSLPLVHLDKIYWRAGWVEPPREEWEQHLAAELAQPQWILDGNYGRTVARRLQAADTAILLDLPRWLCMGRALQRLALGWGRLRPDMAAGCPERLDAAFLRYVWKFRTDQRPQLLADLAAFQGRTVVLRSPAEVRHWLRTLRHEEIPAH